jgi:exodeoxyribonuclease VII large subunit
MIMYDNKKQKLDNMYEKLKKIISLKVERMGTKLDHLKRSYVLTNPKVLYIDEQKQLQQIIEKLELINPLGVLKRGYTLTYKDDKIIKSISNIKANDNLNVRFNDGMVDVKVIGIKE